jgi:hypothetical protein
VCLYIHPSPGPNSHALVSWQGRIVRLFLYLFTSIIRVFYLSYNLFFPAGKKTLLQLLLLANFYWLNEEGK